ncbi:MAG: DUF4349 domain-containing protein [Actinomycetota bacterium]|nr:DUF4349 domain-containing protein [Actinomycetota bacterium]
MIGFRLAPPLIVMVLLAGLFSLLAGCSSGGSTADRAAGGDDGALAADTADGPRSGPAERDGDAVTASRAAVVSNLKLTPTYLIQKASITVRAAEVGAALEDVRGIVLAADGIVADESTQADDEGDPTRSTLVLRVPARSFDSAIAELSALGDLESLSRSSEDVSTEVVDVRSPVRSAEATLRRIRILLDRATDLGDVISLESELSQRQADLEALQAQQAYLADQTALSTIQLTLLSPDEPAPNPPHDDGFLSGLAAGWGALITFLTGTATVLGALLPFLVLALLLGVPLWLVVRRWTARRPAHEPTG